MADENDSEQCSIDKMKGPERRTDRPRKGLAPARRASRQTSAINVYSMHSLSSSLCLILLLLQTFARCQLPEDMQRDLNQGLAEQARIQAMRDRQQQLMQSRSGAGQPQVQSRSGVGPSQQQQKPFDPNNYSFQQVSPPMQYSYYQPYGDAAANQQPQQQQPPPQAGGAQNGAAPRIDIDLNNLNFDMPTPQAPAQARASQAAQPIPSFTGVAGLPVMQPPAAASNQQDSSAQQAVPFGQAPLAPQAQQARPLSEADFKDITGGENYGAPSGGDFGLGGSNAASNNNNNQRQDNTDAQLREFGMPSDAEQQQAARPAAASRRQDLAGFDFGDLGNPMGGEGGGGGRRSSPDNANNMFGADFFESQQQQPQAMRRQPSSEFDFASQPSSDRASSPGQSSSGAPGSLQALLGGAFPGLGGGRDTGTMGLESLAQGSGSNDQSMPGGQQRADDGAMDLADLGGAGGTDSRADGFPGVGDIGGGSDFGGLGAPSGQQQRQDQPDQSGSGQDFGLAAAAAAPQPKTVPYPDNGPQFVGSLWALGQPQSLSQTRYNALPDKGTYQDYPAYQSGGNDFGAVREVVDSTPRARASAPGRYAQPSSAELAPEWRQGASAPSGGQFDYSRSPLELRAQRENEIGDEGESTSLIGEFED